MEIVAWILVVVLGAWLLVVVFAALAAILAYREEENPYRAALDAFFPFRKGNPYSSALRRLDRQLEEGEAVGTPDPDDPPEVRRLRMALTGKRLESPGAKGEGKEDPGERALLGLVRYVQQAVVTPLREALDRGGEPGLVQDAVSALEDLEAYSGNREGEPVQAENLVSVIQSVTREYALETGVPVKFRGPGGAIPVKVAPERFKDAFFFFFSNAGRFGEGRTVEVVAEVEGGTVWVRVRDRGPGFAPDALERAFEPFWTTEADALGMGLTQAQRLLALSGARVQIGNREDDEGGAEVSVSLDREG